MHARRVLWLAGLIALSGCDGGGPDDKDANQLAATDAGSALRDGGISDGGPASNDGDDCAGVVCENGGTCVDGVNAYSCACAAGFSGTHCEVNDDDCAGVVCENGGTCVDGVGAYACHCVAGFHGSLCELEQCGDGTKTASEACDDGDLVDGNGCSSECRVEWAYSCDTSVQPSICGSVCGDGLKASSESCDDGNTENDDGCSSTCTLELPLNFDCALDNHLEQLAAAPDHPYIEPTPLGVTLERLAPSAGFQPVRLTWDPLLEEVPGCNGLPWTPNATDRPLTEFRFLVALDASWVQYFAANTSLFAAQGYPTLEASANILIDRVTYLFEAQFGVRIGISRVVALPGLLEKCAEDLDGDGSPDSLVENGVPDETSTVAALANQGITVQPDEAGLLRLGVGNENVYCHSFAPLNGLCGSSVFTNQQKPFADDGSGRLNHQAPVTLAHEMGHFFGICLDTNHPHCLNAHTANQIPDIMVWDGTPVDAVRTQGVFMKFLTTCTPVYDELLCAAVQASSGICGTPLTCENGGLDCETTYWTASRNGPSDRQVAARSDRFPALCCGGDAPTTTCLAAGLGGLLSVGPDQGCSGEMTWPEADRFCRQANRRLCTWEELEDATLCGGAGCGYDQARGWTATPLLDASAFVGSYQRQPVENGWHDVSIVLENGELFWTNIASQRWQLHWQNGELWTGNDCPYGISKVSLDFIKDSRGQITKRLSALRFNGERYERL